MQTATEVDRPLEGQIGARPKLIIANWKMNVPDLNLWAAFPKLNAEVVICPPFSHLKAVGDGIPNIKLGAQDAFWEEKGAYTGEVSPELLKETGVEYVIVGHSERRNVLGETDEMVNKKASAALGEGLKAILCVGEPLEIRKNGLDSSKEFVKNQIEKDLAGISTDLFRNLVMAYEPVWAISTSPDAEADTPENAVQMIRFMKSLIPNSTVRFIYGGSVNRNNSTGFLKEPEIEGALVGKASLDIQEFQSIINSYGN